MKRLFIPIMLCLGLLAGCVKGNGPILDSAYQVESIVNFSLLNSRDVENNINGVNDNGQLVKAIIQYNETADVNVFEAAKRKIRDTTLIKRIIILQSGLGTR